MAGTNCDSRFFSRVGGFFDIYWPLIAEIIGVLILAFSTVLITSLDQLINLLRWQTWIELVGIFLFCNGTYLLAEQNSRVYDLDAENQQLQALIKNLGDDVQDKWRVLLIPVFEELNLGNNCRVSVYRHEDSNFIMLGRFAPDPEKEKTGRGYYPSDQGCIGQAYRNGHSYEFNLPDPSLSEYYKISKCKWKIDTVVAENFKMKSRSIAAFALEEKKTYLRPLVIVFESTEVKAFTVRKLRTVCESYNDTLCGLVKALEPILPSLQYAKQKGF